jgi:hypothetical protein
VSSSNEGVLTSEELIVALTGTKHELAQRAYEKLSQVRREGVLVENDDIVSNAENATISSSVVNIPSFEELTAIRRRF